MALYYSNSFYVFGGRGDGDKLRTIARLNPIDGRWSRAGRLNKPREWHNVIQIDDEFLVIGKGSQH